MEETALKTVDTPEIQEPEVMNTPMDRAASALVEAGKEHLLSALSVSSGTPFEEMLRKMLDYHISVMGTLHITLENPTILKDVDALTDLTNAIVKQSSIIQKYIFEKLQIDKKEEVDFNHPKIQKAFSFLFEMFIESLKQSNMSEATINQILNNLSRLAVGFEDRINRSLRNVSLAALDSTQNPLVSKAMGREEV